jgi:hypothetical protein
VEEAEGLPKDAPGVDVERKQIVYLEVTDERTGDSVMMMPLVESALQRCR